MKADSALLPSFDVLKREQPIRRHALLEASAGTGKTFAIENIVVRLLIEEEPLTLEEILVVTFTRAATRDLKLRIRSNLEKTLKILTLETTDSCADYLLNVIEKGPAEIAKAKRRIEQAIFTFDHANIFTIHGFCWRSLKNFALEGSVSLEASSKEETAFLGEKIDRAIRDFLRTELDGSLFTKAQLRRLLEWSGNAIEKLEAKLSKAAKNGVDIAPPEPVDVQFAKFQSAMHQLKTLYGMTCDTILQDVEELVPSFKDLAGELPQKMVIVKRFTELFHKDQWNREDFDLMVNDGIYLLEIFAPSQLKMAVAKKNPEILNHPLLSGLKTVLLPAIGEAISGLSLFARLAHHCQVFLRRYVHEEEMIGHDDLLLKMQQAVELPPFAEKIRKTYRAAIVDEFQDTDPVQWEIFSTLFLQKDIPWNGYLYLVGDPKQSIYAFRQADIYTYLSAADRLGEKAIATLNTNFRSQPKLIDALNSLFGAVENLFPLPKRKGSLPYRPVRAGKSVEKLFADGGTCLQFWMVPPETKMKSVKIEEEYFIPAIAKELQRLKSEDGISYGKCAILIKDEYQGARVKSVLEALKIPVKAQKAASMADSPSAEAMREVLDGILHFQHLGTLKLLLAGPILSFTCKQIIDLFDGEEYSRVMTQCSLLRTELREKGFASFYNTFMNSKWEFTPTGKGKSVRETLLEREGGSVLYQELEHLADLLIAEEGAKGVDAEGLIAFIDQFERLQNLNDERMKSYFDPDEEGVAAITTHSSKGLEFDVVFCIGLSESFSPSEDLIYVDSEKRSLKAVEKESPEYLEHTIEIGAEKMRQLYVGFTRAKYRLYIPFTRAENSKKIDPVSTSPVDLFISSLESVSPLESFINAHADTMSIKVLEKKSFSTISNEFPPPPLLLPPKTIEIPGEERVIQSFTSILHGSATGHQIGEVQIVPHDYGHELKNPHTLPSSKETGILLHHLLEIIPFNVVKGQKSSECLAPWVAPALLNTPFAPWEEVISSIVYQALTYPLGDEGEKFCLADIDPKKIYRETEFIYACELSTPPDGIKMQPGFLKGVIDLLFEHKGKYYVLDWKSNWLGDSTEAYSASKIEQAMLQNRYDVQARLYTEALERYLKVFNIDFDEAFGGAYYLFLRGLGPGTGVWAAKTREVCRE